MTAGIRLNDLVGREFMVGEARLKGVRLCEPCAHLSGFLGDAIMQHIVHKAGLRAQILADGDINVSDPVVPAL